jgi:chromosome segregation ATPase
MSEQRFFCKVNEKGRNIIVDKDCHYRIKDMYRACDYLNRLDLKLKTYNEQIGEQQATIENYRKSRDKWRTKCHQAEEKVEYWKHKSLDLYKLLRRVNLSDKEWEEFLNIINEKEIEDE